MKIKLLIATADSNYAEHLSNILSEKYANTFEVSVCSSAERLQDLLAANRFDAGLLEHNFTFADNLKSISLPLVFINEAGFAGSIDNGLKKIRKYQRISSIVGNILENYAEIDKNTGTFGINNAHITAVWSPAGGTGKTTVALAYAARKVYGGKQATYLNLENFSSTSVYFQENGKSISKVFEKLESNVHMFLMGIRQQDSGTGIAYFGGPENYDDINILTADDIETIISACAAGTDELVIDLSSYCDQRIQRVFSLADTILIICDQSGTSQAKLKQFINQHNIFRQTQAKTILINNKGARVTEAEIKKTIQLPHVQSTDPVAVYKALSGGNFEW